MIPGMFAWILLEAISSNGTISADWVLVGITSIACILFAYMLRKIDRNVDTVLGTIAIHHTKIELLIQADVSQDEIIKELKESVKKKRP